MLTLLPFLLLFLFIALIVSLVLLPFKRFRRRAKRTATISGPIFLAAFIIFAVMAVRHDDDDARRLGFTDDADRKAAQEAGITDADAWRERQRLAEATKAKERQAQEEQRRLAEEMKAKEAQAQEEQKRRAAALQQALLKPPAEQARFIQAIERARAAYKAGETDLQRGAARPMRAREICTALPSSDLKQWVGQIHLLTTNGSGDGVLVVEISKGVRLLTMTDSFSDSMYGTMIRAGSSLYQKLLEMKEGDFVRFDAKLFPATDDCYKEISLTMQGSIEEPEFVTSFTRITRIDLPSQ